MSFEPLSDILLISLHPEHAARIYLGEKKAELRKTFPGSTKIVFVYETAPVSALTGAFWVKQAIRTSVQEAITLASAGGVGVASAEKYYEGHEYGWVIQIGNVVKFKRPLQLIELKSRNHYFAIPQTFLYLKRSEGLTQELMHTLQMEWQSALQLKPLSDANKGYFEELVTSTVGGAYEDIDRDFLDQVLDRRVGSQAAFSTREKSVLEMLWGNELIGFTVLTEKVYGGWKSGPTALLPQYRGLGFGQSIRRLIEEYCVRRGAIGIYCTCAESQPATVSYLLNNGMRFQARLGEHLARGRAELVFAKKLKRRRAIRVAPPTLSTNLPSMGRVVRIRSSHQKLDDVLDLFLRQMAAWYFKPKPGLRKAIRDSLLSKELGTTLYSAKCRSLYACLDKSGTPQMAALLTEKRSQMLKINLVAAVRSSALIKALLSKALKEMAPYRRVYLTVPAREMAAIQVLEHMGFSFEGILEDPFGAGANHICYGLIPGKPNR